MPFGRNVNDALLFPEELMSIRAGLLEAPEDELLDRAVLSLKTDDPAWAEVIGFDRMTKTGAAKIMNMQGTNIPLVDVTMERQTQRVYQIACGYRLGDMEVEMARAVGRPVEPIKTAAVRRFMAEEENSIAFNGDASVGLQGLRTLTGRLTHAATQTCLAGSTHWHDCTETEGSVLLAHIRQVRALHAALTGYLPLGLVLSQTNRELLTLFVNDQRSQTVIGLLAGLGWYNGGAAIFSSPLVSDDELISIDNRPDHVQLSITKDITPLEPFRNSPFTQIIAAEQRTAGLVGYYPMSVAILTGIHG